MPFNKPLEVGTPIVAYDNMAAHANTRVPYKLHTEISTQETAENQKKNTLKIQK